MIVCTFWKLFNIIQAYEFSLISSSFLHQITINLIAIFNKIYTGDDVTNKQLVLIQLK